MTSQRDGRSASLRKRLASSCVTCPLHIHTHMNPSPVDLTSCDSELYTVTVRILQCRGRSFATECQGFDFKQAGRGDDTPADVLETRGAFGSFA